MNPLILVGFLTFFVVALTVGVRLLLLWGRTRQLPELLMGIGVPRNGANMPNPKRSCQNTTYRWC